MSGFFYFVLAAVPTVALIILTTYSMKMKRQGKPAKRILASNMLVFVLVLTLTAGFAFSVSAADNTDVVMSEEEANTTEDALTATGDSIGLGLIAAALVTGLAGIGGGIAVAAGAPAAIAATSEDPKAFGKSLIFVALGESIALYGVVISILILNKI